jgi:Cof subfamily protein (haloacid dehalogenase superfamily)
MSFNPCDLTAVCLCSRNCNLWISRREHPPLLNSGVKVRKVVFNEMSCWMSSYRLIAIDLDGTLLLPDGTVSPRNREAVHRAVAAGFDVVFATGRNFNESRRILDAVGHGDMGIFVSGAIVMDLRQQTVIRRMGMDSQLAREVSAVIEEMGYPALALQDHDRACADYIATSDVELNKATSDWMALTSATIERVGSVARHPHPCTIRVGLVAAHDETARIEKAIVERFGGRVIVHSLYVPAYDVEVLEVFDPAVSKWQGVLHIAGLRGLTPAQIVAVGDDVNDLSMITGAGLGAAMGNAKANVAAAAKRVLRSNSENGLAEFLDELVQQKEESRPPRSQGAAMGCRT